MTKTPTHKRNTAAAPAEIIAPKASPRPDTKKARLIARLEHARGVDVATLSTELGWQPHSTRAALTGLRKDGYTIERLPSRARPAHALPDRGHQAMSGTPDSPAGNDVAILDTLDRAALIGAWRRTIKTPTPTGISRRLMMQILTYEAQVRARGGLKPAVRRRLARWATGRAQAPSPRLRPGARLVREWNGVSHVVDVTEEGLVWRGQRYGSLSAVARAITGTRWSGPRFFGLLAEHVAA
jgi:Protein of unknown function (DUF2924)/Protein of unknown function (DUF3489)